MGKKPLLYGETRKARKVAFTVVSVQKYADRIKPGEQVRINTYKCTDELMGQKKEVPRTATVTGVCGRIVRLRLPSGVEDDISLKDYALIRQGGGAEGIKYEYFTPERLGDKGPDGICRYKEL